MAYRNKTYVAFDGDVDIAWYWLLKAWAANGGFDFYDAHDVNNARDTSSEESIKRQLLKRFDNSKMFILLLGEHTAALRKFLPWEIKQALARKLPIIVVNLNGKRAMDPNRCPKILRESLAIHIPYKKALLKYAMDNWPDSDKEYRRRGKSGPFCYRSSVYSDLGID
ncbi:TIR domain-containing protein [Bifidobacterium choloepi]|uniref:Molecular chaperone Tir n=1 Tax=Bifidobacterium choloepi TaxID=2614131 RepID=A0A6I5NNR5_9BIFI|nr:TIR domain-containing protein [Bifidobacterium choloepi]NEG70342.1 molecular chaperone Tir [Bifidobacterium choloepi]